MKVNLNKNGISHMRKNKQELVSKWQINFLVLLIIPLLTINVSCGQKKVILNQ